MYTTINEINERTNKEYSSQFNIVFEAGLFWLLDQKTKTIVEMKTINKLITNPSNIFFSNEIFMVIFLNSTYPPNLQFCSYEPIKVVNYHPLLKEILVGHIKTESIALLDSFDGKLVFRNHAESVE